MLSKQELDFIVYWQKNRERQQTLKYQLLYGLPLGLSIGAGIVLMIKSGWYERANMVANGKSTPLILILAIIIITVFCGFFYKKFQWEQKEQQYLELLAKQKKDAAKNAETKS
jgi:uncharacterized membrane protein